MAADANDTDTQTTHGKTTTTTHDTQDATTYGKTRTWTDGRTWTQVLADVWAATSPVYDFVNAFAQILLSPDTVCVIWEPTMSMTADAEKLAPGSQPTATIVNVGTATHPRWELHLGLVTGDTGATPEITVTASVDDNVGTPEVTVTQTGTPEHPDIDFEFKNMKGKTGATGATPDITMTATVDDTTGTPSVQVTEGGTPEEPTFNLAFSGLKGASAAGGGKVYRHCIRAKAGQGGNSSAYFFLVAFFDFYSSDPTPITAENIIDKMAGVTVIVNGGGKFGCKNGSLDFNTPRQVSVSSNGVTIWYYDENISPPSPASYTFAVSSFSEFDDAVQEMP